MKLATVLATVIALTSTPVVAQNYNCADTDDIYAMIENEFDTPRKMWAQAGPDQIIEFWGGEKMWVLIATLPTGQSCVIAAGQDWGMAPEAPNL